MKKISKVFTFVLALSFVFVFSGVAGAAEVTPEQIAQMQAQLSELRNTVQTLQKQAKTNGISLTIPGCNGTTGFSTVTGESCAGNIGNVKFYNFGTVTLKNGSRGEAVKELQRFLNDKLGLGLAVDGKLGPKTIAIIKKWQKENGLTPDGLVGTKTKIIMNSL